MHEKILWFQFDVPIRERAIEEKVKMDAQQTATMNAAQVVLEDKMSGARKVAETKKRDLKLFWKKSLELAELCGEDGYFLWEQKSRDRNTDRMVITEIKGLSASMIQSVLALYGNVWSDAAPIQETQGAWVFTVQITDLETNYTLTRQFRMDKNFPVYGKHDEYRKNDIRFAIGYSKAFRNAGKSLLPPGLEDAMIEVGRKSVRGKIEQRIADYEYEFQQKKHREKGLQRYASELVAGFALVGVELGDLEKRIGIEMRGWTIESFVQLVPDLKALKAGTVELADYLGGINNKPEAEKPDTKPGLSTENMSQGDPDSHQGYKNSDENGKSELPLGDDAKKGKGGF